MNSTFEKETKIVYKYPTKDMLVLKYIIITEVGWCHVKNSFCGRNWIIWRPPDNIPKIELLSAHNSNSLKSNKKKFLTANIFQYILCLISEKNYSYGNVALDTHDKTAWLAMLFWCAGGTDNPDNLCLLATNNKKPKELQNGENVVLTSISKKTDEKEDSSAPCDEHEMENNRWE